MKSSQVVIVAATVVAVGTAALSWRRADQGGTTATTQTAPPPSSSAPIAHEQQQEGNSGSPDHPDRTASIESILAGNSNLPEAFKEKVRRNVAAIRRGDPVVEAGSVPGLNKRIAAMSARLKSVEDVIAAGLSRPPSDLSATALGDATLVGAAPTGTRINGNWTGLGRAFQHPDLGPIILSEVDLNAGNIATATMPSEAVNIRVRSQPGVLSVLSDPESGLSMTRLKWVAEEGISYEMLCEQTSPAAKEALHRIAELIRP